MPISAPSDPPGLRRLSFDEPPEEWCARYDRAPTIIPEWPGGGTAVVFVLEVPGGSAAFAVQTPTALTLAAMHAAGRRLFFRVPKGTLVKAFPELAAFWE